MGFFHSFSLHQWFQKGYIGMFFLFVCFFIIHCTSQSLFCYKHWVIFGPNNWTDPYQVALQAENGKWCVKHQWKDLLGGPLKSVVGFLICKTYREYTKLSTRHENITLNLHTDVCSVTMICIVFKKKLHAGVAPRLLISLIFSLFTEQPTRTSRTQRGQRSQRTWGQTGKITVCVCVSRC